MKPKTPTGIKLLRVVSIAVTLISLVVIGSVLYSAYTDYRAVQDEFGGAAGHRPTVNITTEGTARMVTLSFTVSNRGLYTLTVSLSCDNPPPDIVCSPASVNVPSGQEKVMQFQFTVSDYSKYAVPGSLHINGTVGVQMAPFVDLSVGTDFASLASPGSA